MPTTNPVPSTDPSDLLFNAGKLDEVVNGTANTFTDRLGVARRTVAGMNADFDAQLADAESDLNVYRADAAASAAEALGYLQTIRATSYGAYASDPATDPLGNPPTVGDEYFNTTANLLKRWNGTTWQASDINTANLAASSGSSLVGYDGGTVQDVLDDAKPMQSYTALRNYTGRATGVRITTPGIAGFFQRKGTLGLADDGGLVIIDASGRSWERIYVGPASFRWFGAKGDWSGTSGADDSDAIQAAFNQRRTKWLAGDFGVFRITKTITITPFQGDGTASQQGTYVQDWDIDWGSATLYPDGVSGPVFDIVTGPFPQNSYKLKFKNASWRCPTANPPTGACIQLRGGHHWATEIEGHRQIGPTTPHFVRIVNDSAVGQSGYNVFRDIQADAVKTITLEKTAGGLAEFDNYVIENVLNGSTSSDAAAVISMVGGVTMVSPSINKLIAADKGSLIRGGSNGSYVVNGKINGLYSESNSPTVYGVESGLISTEISNIFLYSADTTAQSCVAVLCNAGAHVKASGIRVFDAGINGLPYDSRTYGTVVLGANVRDVDIEGFSPAQAKRAISADATTYDIRAGGASLTGTVTASFTQSIVNTTAITAIKTINSSKITQPNSIGGSLLRVRALGNRWGDSSTFRFFFRAADSSFSIPIGLAVTDATTASFVVEADIIVQPDGVGGLQYVLHRGSINYNGTVSYTDRGRNIETRVSALPNTTVGLYVDMTYGTTGGIAVDAVTFELVGAGL